MAETDKASRRTHKKLHCAIYTRKSTDEGLDQAFNSLDAQREACAAFVQSQKHEGWVLSPTLYDDGGYSGGNLERPALKRLLADIEAGRIDVVVVYKVDRITRALSDFAKLVDVFDRRGVSFVSITQQFNTTTSMGRLTLNVLLSFAQFEREVIGERVRDKIAASKKKGMWMGGMPPLGYDVKDRKLVVNKQEAHSVIDIYRRYLALKSVHTLADELAKAGIHSKHRVRTDGTAYGGNPFSRGALYEILQNRAYRGEVTHKGNAYPGEHRPIIEKQLWDEVQAVLATNRIERVAGRYTRHPSLLTGLIFDDNGRRLTPAYTIKKGTRYRYYVSTAFLTGTKASRTTGMRLPAGDLENLILDRLRSFLTDPSAVLDALPDELPSGAERTRLMERSCQIAEDLASQAPGIIKKTLMTIGGLVTIKPDRINITLSQHRLAGLLDGQAFEQMCQAAGDERHARDVVKLEIAARLTRVGREMKILIAGTNAETAADPSLLRLIARAHDIQDRLAQNTELTVHDVAQGERISAAYIYTLLRLPWLAPDITTAIVNGRQPLQLNAMTLMRKASRLPAEWTEQRALLGFR